VDALKKAPTLAAI